MSVRRIAVVTGSRAEYGLLRSVMRAIAADPRLRLRVLATGMHVLTKFGDTINDIVADGFGVDARVRMQNGTADPLDQASGLARGVRRIAEFLEADETDMVVVLGDRIEALAGALAAVTTGRSVAHIHGGDVAPGDFDESIRHAITKLAHVHFAATRESARRIVRMGESVRRVHCVGAPGLDRLREILNGQWRMVNKRTEARRHGGTKARREETVESNTGPFALVVQHAYGRAAEVEERTMNNVLAAVRAAGLRRVIIYPNSDRGHDGVIHAIEAHVRAFPDEAVVHRSLPRDMYLRELIAADVLVGNSSSGLIEAPLAGTPAVDVGLRQRGRQAGGSSVVRAAETRPAVLRAIRQALRMPPRPGRRTVYGDGRAGARIARILAGLPPGEGLRRKRITY
jgi:UDP-hydrolysing UDP-N-acetyl-D-glucosamine 2-epimerase